MPLTEYKGFCGPTYQGRSNAIATDRCINFYPEAHELGDGKNEIHLIGTPGLKKLWTTGKNEPIREICTIGAKRILFAGYDTLYEVDVYTGAISELGKIAPDNDWEGLAPVTFAWNGVQYMISSGGHGYILEDTTLTEVLEADHIAYLDGCFCSIRKGDKQVRFSELYDGLTWDPLMFKEKESARDYPTALVADHGELFVLGEQSSEVWYFSGAQDVPFDRRPEGRLELGCAAGWSPAKLDNSLFWIGADVRGNRVVWRAEGYQAKRISNHAIEYHLNKIIPKQAGAGIDASGTTFALGWAYQEEGHSFYCITFPNPPKKYSQVTKQENKTAFLYDAATGFWHERAYWNPHTGLYEVPRQRCHAYIWDHHLVGDRENGTIYEQHLDYYDDAGDRIRRERTGPVVWSGGKQQFFSSFHLEMDVAVGLGVIDSDLYGPDMFGKEYKP